MKKVTFVALSLLAVVSFTSCGGNGSTEATPACDTCTAVVDTTKVVDTTATPTVDTTMVAADTAKAGK